LTYCNGTHVAEPVQPDRRQGGGRGRHDPAPAAIVAVIEDALAPFGVSIAECPITPARIVELIDAGGRARAEAVPPRHRPVPPGRLNTSPRAANYARKFMSRAANGVSGG